MNKCKFCQAEMAENGTFCPACGKDNNEEIIAETPVEETSVMETPVEEISDVQIPTAEDIVAQEEAFVEAMPKPSTGKIGLAIAAVVVLLAVLIALLVGGMNKKTEPAPEATESNIQLIEATIPADGNPDDVTCKGTYTASDEEVIAAADVVVATAGDIELTNSELQIYYWLEVQSFLQNYGYYATLMGLDYTRPLDTQMCTMMDSGTWQQYFLDSALLSWQNYQSMAAEAVANGHQLADENQNYIDYLVQSLEESAAANGFENAEALLAYNVGNGSSLDDYVKFNLDYLLGYEYYEALSKNIALTEEEIAEYFQANAAAYAEQGVTEDTIYVDVRHILVMPESTVAEDGTSTVTDEAWAASEAEAQAILDQWLAGDKTEDSFAALANEFTADGNDANRDGVPDGGLYTDVYVGQMVPEFEAWCFDASRQIGDTGLVKTTYGWHVMYFVGSKPAWPSYAEGDLMNERIAAVSEEINAKYPLTVDYSKILLGFVDMNA